MILNWNEPTRARQTIRVGYAIGGDWKYNLTYVILTLGDTLIIEALSLIREVNKLFKFINNSYLGT